MYGQNVQAFLVLCEYVTVPFLAKMVYPCTRNVHFFIQQLLLVVSTV